MYDESVALFAFCKRPAPQGPPSRIVGKPGPDFDVMALSREE
jgi:hypothetical protein